MDIQLRFAVETDCPRLLELIHELAVYEKMPKKLLLPLRSLLKQASGSSRSGKLLSRRMIMELLALPFTTQDTLPGRAVVYILKTSLLPKKPEVRV